MYKGAPVMALNLGPKLPPGNHCWGRNFGMFCWVLKSVSALSGDGLQRTFGPHGPNNRQGERTHPFHQPPPSPLGTSLPSLRIKPLLVWQLLRPFKSILAKFGFASAITPVSVTDKAKRVISDL